ncbi:DUF3558 domain-containing protein [Amycolatopsis sp. WQ 127309]|uniref:DUF3558 domain-containing protein n=1 Tax=Amycolatopsis sp. WQ 127309 TaxID=2932773 RepID=UPI001FF68AD1|nr:DUF3558 domain-containing protein [Amycolatopsis sp. WQ 127309]UOZ08970.1 DUF3558 domain-containing protein [Amycolatopsis sp. WQ 127309]
MNRQSIVTLTVAATCAALLSGCNGEHGTATPAPTSSATTPGSDVPDSGAPAVANPLPDQVLAGSPCDTALTAAQVSDFLGDTGPGKTEDAELGPLCQWDSTSGSGAGLTVGYDTKSDQGLSLAYKNTKPKSSLWKELSPVQEYPAIAYGDTSDKRLCNVVVGVTDKLTYGVTLILGDRAAADGKDACEISRSVADLVLTNLKARA